MEIHFQDVPAHRCHYARHYRLQHGRYGVRRANRHRGTGRRRFARVAVLFIADDAQHVDRRRRLHGHLRRTRRKKHRKSQSSRRSMHTFEPCGRHFARRRGAAFSKRLPALFRRRCRHVGLHRTIPANFSPWHARHRIFQCLCKPRPCRGCRTDRRPAQHARHCRQYYT